MKSQKFMLIALVLLAMIPEANPREIFTGASAVVIGDLYIGLQDAFIQYATAIASDQTTDAGQRLQVEVAAYNALTENGAIVEYFRSLDGTLRQSIFEGVPVTQSEVSAVWGMINTWYSTMFSAGQALGGILSTSPGEFVTNLPRFLISLSEFAMIANCIGIAYKGATVMYSVARIASSIVASCGRVTIGTLKSLNAWRKSSGGSVISLAAAASSSAAAASSSAAAKYLSPEEMLNLIANMPPDADNTPVDEIFTFEDSIDDVSFINLVNALRNNGFNVVNRDVIMTRTSSDPIYRRSHNGPFDTIVSELSVERRFSGPAVLETAPYQRASADPEEETNYGSQKTTGVKRKDRGGRTKKHLKKKQRKSIRKQRKTKRSKRAPSRKSRRYKK